MGSEQPSRKRPRSKSDSKDGNEGNIPSAIILDSSHRSEALVAVNEVVVETSWKGKEKVKEEEKMEGKCEETSKRGLPSWRKVTSATSGGG
ncbi:hypothetical protein R1flu_004580 [Riccia fluitans]|uniref:Uncharacterized protein n=1 Tax=Riccia fluitans TaxID=41844 RepID=A0ABD1YQQ4_9MARC